MAHLVPDPPPVNYQNPTLTSFGIASADGVARILAWGLDRATPWPWRVGTDDPMEVQADSYLGPQPDLTLFLVRGARQGMKLAIFHQEGGSWQRYSAYVEVTSNMADHYAAALASGTLPKSTNWEHILFYPFGATQSTPPLSEADWMTKVDDGIRLIKGNTVGMAVLANLPEDIVVYPYVQPYDNANSAVHINPARFPDGFKPGSRMDEILIHELIHRTERNAGGYENRYGFMFDGTDFLTVNATNVYSCMLGRGLRKDHHDFQFLPEEHFRDPKLHFDQQKPNYELAHGRVPTLVDTIKNVTGVWNPFSNL